MFFDAIIVDVFNLYYRRARDVTSKDPKEIANRVIDFVTVELVPMLNKTSTPGKVYLLYDPMPINDLGLSKAVRHKTTPTKSTRKLISRAYKQHRPTDANIYQAVGMVKQYFSNRDPMYVSMMGSGFEADDFVEPLLKSIGSDKLALLVTTDLDWCRYVSPNVLVAPKNPATPSTQEDFRARYGFLPTIASVTLSKAMFGDPSDGIVGAIFSPKKKQPFNFSRQAEDWVREIGESGEDLNTILSRVKTYTFANLFPKKDRNTEQDLYLKFLGVEDINIPRNIEANVRLIRSRCADVSSFTESRFVKDEGFCKLIDNMLERGANVKRPFKFGVKYT